MIMVLPDADEVLRIIFSRSSVAAVCAEPDPCGHRCLAAWSFDFFNCQSPVKATNGLLERVRQIVESLNQTYCRGLTGKR